MMNKARIYKLLLMATTFLPAFTFCYTISSFSQEQTWFPPEALILSSCIAFTADDALKHVRSPPEGKYSEQPESQANLIAKIYSKQIFFFLIFLGNTPYPQLTQTLVRTSCILYEFTGLFQLYTKLGNWHTIVLSVSHRYEITHKRLKCQKT